MNIRYLIVDLNYLKHQGQIRALRFAKSADNLYDLLSILESADQYRDYKIIAMEKDKFDELQERIKKLCF